MFKPASKPVYAALGPPPMQRTARASALSARAFLSDALGLPGNDDGDDAAAGGKRGSKGGGGERRGPVVTGFEGCLKVFSGGVTPAYQPGTCQVGAGGATAAWEWHFVRRLRYARVLGLSEHGSACRILHGHLRACRILSEHFHMGYDEVTDGSPSDQGVNNIVVTLLI